MESNQDASQQALIDAAIAYAEARQKVIEIDSVAPRGNRPWSHQQEFDKLMSAENALLKCAGVYTRPGCKRTRINSNAGLQ